MSGPSTPAAAPSGPLAVVGAAVLVLAIALAVLAAVRWPVPLVAEPAVAVAAGESVDPTPGAASREALVKFLQDHPRNGRGWVLLGLMDAEAARYAEAAASFEKAVAVSPKVAADPAVWCEWADALGMTQGGSLQGRPTELVERALALRANHPMALEMAGSAAYERRDFTRAVELWRQLLPQLEEGSLPHRQLAEAIARAERLAATSLPPQR